MRTSLTLLMVSVLAVSTFAFTNLAQSQDKVKVTIEGNDSMQFDLKEIKVKAGETVVLTLKHVGKLRVM